MLLKEKKCRVFEMFDISIGQHHTTVKPDSTNVALVLMKLAHLSMSFILQLTRSAIGE